MAEILKLELKNLDFVIFDFDGTLMKLNVDWTQIRNKLQVSSVEEIWQRTESFQHEAWEVISSAETRAVHTSKTIDSTSSLLPYLNFGVLTNNCEEAVFQFLKIIGIDSSAIPIVGRRWLGTSKKDFKRFTEAIAHIVSRDISELSGSGLRLGYVGDSTFELDFATQLGFVVFKVEENGELTNYLDEGLQR